MNQNKDLEYKILKSKVDQLNMQFANKHKMSTSEWVINSIQSMPTGGDDLFSLIRQSQRHQMKTKMTHSLIDGQHRQEVEFQCQMLNGELKYYKTQANKSLNCYQIEIRSINGLSD